jgi:hypothetical protein
MRSHAQWAFAAALLFTVSTARGDEGMWTFDSPPVEAIRRASGLSLDRQWFDHVRLSSVRLAGCSASFVSPDGLVLTNHHCIRGCLQGLASSERDLQRTGFLAANRTAEERCPAGQASILVGTEDISKVVLAAGKDAAGGDLPADRANLAKKAAMSRLENACVEESKSAGSGPLHCEARELYQGGQAWLHKYKRYTDVRLVFAPEGDIAHFGGDPDNFDFPRYCLDMSLLRVYDNGAPLKTADYLRWSTAGAKPGDTVFVSGHPGSTQRLLTTEQLRVRRDLDFPLRLNLLSELRGRLVEFSKTSPENARVSNSLLLGVENNFKRGRGQLSALLDDEAMARKLESERELRRRVDQDASLREKDGSAWDEIAVAARAYRRLHLRNLFLEGRQGFQGSLFGHAWTLARGAIERPKPSAERLREFADSSLPAIEQRLGAAVPIAKELEIIQLAFSLEKMREYLTPDDPAVRELLGKQAELEMARRLVTGTQLADPERRQALWRDPAAVAASDDPMIVFARRVEKFARPLREAWDNEVEAVDRRNGERIAHARFKLLGTSVYPDATGTLRLTHGSVRGWEKTGVQVEPHTRFAGLFTRATGSEPFVLPQRWSAAQDTLDPSTPMNLVADTDIIGGNSGSPLIDGKGELVGLVFDGNIPSLAGAYWFDATLNRTVAVDSRGMLEALEKVYGATELVREIRGPAK